MTNVIGTGSMTTTTEEYQINKFPKYTVNWAGTEAQVRATGSNYFSHGWNVVYTNGNPWTGVAKLESEVSGDGITPVVDSGSIVTVNWSLHYKTTEKEILHANVQQISWLSQLNENQVNILERRFSDPPPAGQSLQGAEPTFNATWSGSTPTTFSGSYTAGDVIWNMAQIGFKTIPIITPVLRVSVTANSAATLTAFTGNIYRYYTKSSLATTIGIPTNFSAAMPQDTDPSSSATKGITCYYGWLKQPPTVDQNGITLSVQQEYEYGLYPSNIYGTRL